MPVEKTESLRAAHPQPTAPEFLITRVLDAPRALVFRAWTEPAHLAQWWGPRGLTTTCAVDARPGGAYRLVMRSEDGVEYPITGVFREIVAPERIVMTMDPTGHPAAWHDQVNPNRGDDPNPAGILITTATFEDVGGRTRLTVRVQFESAAIRDAMLGMGMTEGWSSSLDRLEELVAVGSSTSDRELAITRLLDAPRELVWKAWTRPEHVAQWWGPEGFTNTVQEMNVTPGGVFRLVMHGPDGRDYPNKIVFLEVVEPERLVYDHSGEAGTEPVNFRVTITFEAQGGKTRFTMKSVFPSVAAKDFVIENYGADKGMVEHVSCLEKHLAQMSLAKETR